MLEAAEINEATLPPLPQPTDAKTTTNTTTATTTTTAIVLFQRFCPFRAVQSFNNSIGGNAWL